MKDTIIVVGITREDEYGNLWVSPQGSGDEIKIAAKRKSLHPLFEQGKAVLLHWETYMDKPYVSDAKLVEGELPQQQGTVTILPEHQAEIDKARAKPETLKPQPQEIGMWWKEVGECIRAKLITPDQTSGGGTLYRAYFAQMKSVLGITEEKKKEG